MPSPRRASEDAIIRATRLLIAGWVLSNHQMAGALGINATDLQVLNTIDLYKQVTPRDLAEKTGLSTAGVTVALDRLEKARYVERVANPADRRSVLVRAAVKSAHPAYQIVEKRMYALLSRYSASQLSVVLDFLTRATPLEPAP